VLIIGIVDPVGDGIDPVSDPAQWLLVLLLLLWRQCGPLRRTDNWLLTRGRADPVTQTQLKTQPSEAIDDPAHWGSWTQLVVSWTADSWAVVVDEESPADQPSDSQAIGQWLIIVNDQPNNQTDNPDSELNSDNDEMTDQLSQLTSPENPARPIEAQASSWQYWTQWPADPVIEPSGRTMTKNDRTVGQLTRTAQ